MDEMKCTPAELRRTLEELYAWYFRKARAGYDIEIDKWTMDEAYAEAADAISAVYLSVFGGRAMFELWTHTMAECEAGEAAQDL